MNRSGMGYVFQLSNPTHRKKLTTWLENYYKKEIVLDEFISIHHKESDEQFIFNYFQQPSESSYLISYYHSLVGIVEKQPVTSPLYVITPVREILLGDPLVEPIAAYYKKYFIDERGSE